MKKILLCLLLACFCYIGHSQQWRTSFKNILTDRANTLLLLQYRSITDQTRDYLLEINFRKKGTYSIVYSREHSIQAKLDAMYTLEFDLPMGVYDVTIDILDRIENEHWLREVEYECNVRGDEIFLSDIFLSYESMDAIMDDSNLGPNLNPTLIDGSEQLFFMVEIYAPTDGPFRSKAVIFKDYPGRPSDAAKNFSSEDNKNDYPMVANGKGVYSDYFEVANLEEGEYELTIYIYDEQDKFVTEKTVNFDKAGSIKQRVFANLDTSIEMMKYATFSQSTIDDIQNKPNEAEKLEAFSRAWQKLYGKRRWMGEMDESVEDRMELFYQNLFDADQLLRENGGTWDSDQGKIYINYGEPTKKSSFQANGNDYERWTYLSWDLSFLFEKRGQSYYLVQE